MLGVSVRLDRWKRPYPVVLDRGYLGPFHCFQGVRCTVATHYQG